MESRPGTRIGRLVTNPKGPSVVTAALRTPGTGIGSALIAPVLEQCDRQGVLVYLESSKEVNIGFYQRHGFEVVREVQVPGGPLLWPMLRTPRGGRGT